MVRRPNARRPLDILRGIVPQRLFPPAIEGDDPTAAAWREARDEAKYAHIITFAERLPAIRARDFRFTSISDAV